MNSPLLITYYNTIPPNATNYFTILDGNIQISNYDMMGNRSSAFMKNINNNLVYIFNGANMGSFTVKSELKFDDNSTTYVINLNSIPLNLIDNVLCVLSISAPTFNISRTYLTRMDSNIGNFTSPDNKKFIINRQSMVDSSTLTNQNTPSSTSSSYHQTSNIISKKEVDDTLFLYIMATNKSFNIIFSATSIYTITDVKILPESNSSSIIFSGIAPPLKFTDNIKYTMYISTEKSSTVSNIVFNNTNIVPLNYSGIDLTTLNATSLNGTVMDMSGVPSGSAEITPVLMNQTLTINNNSLNKVENNLTPTNQCVILNIQNPSYHNLSGYFSLNTLNIPSNQLIKGITTDIIENYSQENSQPPANATFMSALSNIGSVINEKTAELSVQAYNSVINATGIDNQSVISTMDTLNSATKTTINSIDYAYRVANINSQPKTRPDNISNVPLLVGLPSSLNISYYDINNNQCNFIAPNIIIYLSSGLKTYIYSIKSAKNIINKPDENSIFSFDGEINSASLPDYSKNTQYVISTGPISPYITYTYTSVTQYNTPIKNGSYTLGSQSNKIILSNTDSSSINAIPFISLLYTVINTHIPLNILNLDYSVVCSLIITGVALSGTQSTISYSLLSGRVPTNSSSYIFTLLQSSDIIKSVNDSKLYNDILTKNNNLILGIQNSIQKSYINNPNDTNIQEAQTIIANAANQATILLSTSFINNNCTTLQIANATITMAFNAINYALLGDPEDGELIYFYEIVTQLTNPIIVTTLLNNANIHITNLVNNNLKSESLPLFINAQNAINSAITQIAVPSALDSPTLNTPSSVYIPSIKNALSAVNTALISVPDNKDLLKAQSNLLAIEPITTGTYKIEKLDGGTNIPTPSSYDSSPHIWGMICGCVCCLIFMSGVAYLVSSYFTRNDKEFFTSSSEDSYSSSSANDDFEDPSSTE